MWPRTLYFALLFPLPLSVIPEIRLTDKGLVLCPAMKIVPLFEPV